MDKNRLSKPKDPLGYTRQEIQKICDERGIHMELFWDAFGVNTVGLAKDKTPRFYVCDVERALYRLRADGGKFHLWD